MSILFREYLHEYLMDFSFFSFLKTGPECAGSRLPFFCLFPKRNQLHFVDFRIISLNFVRNFFGSFRIISHIIIASRI
jgi:hypothetical protein